MQRKQNTKERQEETKKTDCKNGRKQKKRKKKENWTELFFFEKTLDRTKRDIEVTLFGVLGAGERASAQALSPRAFFRPRFFIPFFAYFYFFFFQ